MKGHEHIVSLRDVIWDCNLRKKHSEDVTECVCIVLELAPAGDLAQFINECPGGLPEHVAKYFFAQLVSGELPACCWR